MYCTIQKYIPLGTRAALQAMETFWRLMALSVDNNNMLSGVREDIQKTYMYPYVGEDKLCKDGMT